MRSKAKAPSTGSIGGIGRRLALVALGIVAVLSAIAPVASAAPTAQPGYRYLNSFGNGGELNGVFINSAAPAVPLALDSLGNVFVANGEGALSSGQPGVVAFAPDPTAGGVLLTGISTPSQYPAGVVIDSVDDDLFAMDPIFDGHIRRYVSDGAAVPTYTEDPGFSVSAVDTRFQSTPGLAIDPTTGDLLVAEFDGSQIERYDQTGALLDTIDLPFPIRGFAVAPDGSIWAGRFVNGGGPSPLKHLSSSGAFIGDLEAGAAGLPEAFAIDPSTGAVVVAVAGHLKRYSAAGVFQSDAVAHSSTTALAIDGDSGRLYQWTGGNHFGGELNAYVPAAFPGIETPSVSSIATESVHVSTEVDPGEENGNLPPGSAMRFEYRLVGDASWTETSDQAVSAAGTFEADINALEPNLTYEVRAVAFNSLTSPHFTAATKVTTASTAPRVETGSATDVSETGATLNGTIHSIGLQATYHFEYGTTTAYGSRVPATIEAVAGSGYEVRPFLRSLSGLQPGVTYHFRLVATNPIGTTEGADRSFTTTAAGGVIGRAYEQVTPVDKSSTIWPNFAFQAKADGSGFAYASHANSESSPIHATMMSLRGQDDWDAGIGLDPPNNVNGGILFFQSTLAISEDFTHTLVASTHAMVPGASENNCNLYVVDRRTGSYQLVVASNALGAFQNFTGIKESDKYLAGAPDFSWVVFTSRVPLLPGVPPYAVYRWSEADGLEAASVLPSGQTTAALRRSNDVNAGRTVSADGKRIYFSTLGSEAGVFLREGDTTKAISVSHVPGDPTTPRPALLLGLSRDGRYAFFGSRSSTFEAPPLTADAPGERGDLYRYDAADGSLEYLGARALVGLAESSYEYGELGTSPDGNTFYFNADLDPNNIQSVELSVWHDGVVRGVTPGAPRTQIFMSPNGRYLAFAGDAVRLYDADADQLSCASCLPDGSPVALPVTNTLPASEVFISNRMPQVVTDDGTVFFTAAGRLVAADVNGTSDVYAYRNGQARLISPGNAPFDALFSDMSEDGRDVFFTTAQKLVGRDDDESTDVYDARIGGGLPAQSPQPPQECLRDDCKATPNSGPEVPFGGSEALSGPGNVNEATPRKRCAKGAKARKVKGKTRCVKQSKANKKKSAKRAKNDRRQGR